MFGNISPAFRRYLVALGSAAIISATAILCLTTYFSSLTGATSLKSMASAMDQNRRAIGLPFSLNWWGLLKVDRLNISPAEVVYISSSRAGTVREQMFRPYQFYNMSFTAWSIDQATEVLERIKNQKPRVVILELDYFMLTSSWKAGNADRSMHFHSFGRYEFRNGIDLVRTYAKNPDILSPKFDLFIGAQAKKTTEGFRWDGSYHYSNGRLVSSEKSKGADYMMNAFAGAPAVDAAQYAALQNFARVAKDANIRVVAIQLPYIKDAVHFLNFEQSYKHYSGIWREVTSNEFHARLADMGIDFFDLSQTRINDDSSNFIDAYHPSELGSLRTMIELSKTDSFKRTFPLLETRVLECDLEKALALRAIYFSYDDLDVKSSCG